MRSSKTMGEERASDHFVKGPPRPSGAPEALPSHAQFGKFQLVARLGKGGMGDVYLAVIKGLEDFKKLVVVKRLHGSLQSDATMRSLFLGEARLAAKLNHPNVVQTNEVGELDGSPYLCMEYLEGQSLAELTRYARTDGKPRPRLFARVVADALTGLHYAHELTDFDGTPLNIIHRDLSPHNIFITYDGVVKIVDFGIAKTSVQMSKTAVGVFKGKVTYMAPEQLRETEIDRRVDIFVLGIVLWETLVGKKLFNAARMEAAFHMVLNEPIPPLSEVVPDIDPALEAIVARALDRDVEKRFGTALEMRDALERYLASGAPVRQEDVGAYLSKAFKKRREWVREQVRAAMVTASEPEELPYLKATQPESGSVTTTDTLVAPAVASARPEKVRPRSRWGLFVAVAVVGVVGAAASYGALRGRGATAGAAETAAAATEKASAPAPVTATPSPEPAADGTATASASASVAEPPASTVDRSPRRVSRGRAPPPPRPPAAAVETAAPSPPAPSPSPSADSTQAKRKFRTEF